MDRVDVCVVDDQALAVVYDYKTKAEGAARPRLLLDPAVQLYTYLLALGGATLDGRPVLGVGVLRAPIYPDADALDTKYVAAAPPDVQRLFLYRPRGAVLAEHARRLDVDFKPGASPVGPFELTKDLKFHKSRSDTPTQAEWQETLDLCRATLTQAAEGLAAGVVDPAPLATGSPRSRTLACKRCEFASVCRFDRAYNRPRPAELSLPERPAKPRPPAPVRKGGRT
jgi:ATP-dependent helicase/DNAse subunit B